MPGSGGQRGRVPRALRAAASTAQRRLLSDDALLVHIKLARGIRVGKERVQKLMQLHGIRAKGRRRFKVTTDSNHDLRIAPNLLDRQLTVVEPDGCWRRAQTPSHLPTGDWAGANELHAAPSLNFSPLKPAHCITASQAHGSIWRRRQHASLCEFTAGRGDMDWRFTSARDDTGGPQGA
jgi:hypothetical protein